jgi:DNA-binding NarL/FixJ family response regulator
MGRALFARVATGEQPADVDHAEVQELLNLGLLREDATGLVPVDPGYVGARLEADLHTAAARMLTRAATVSESLHDLRTAYDRRSTQTAGVMEYLRGSEAINARLGQVLAGTTTEFLVCQPGGERRREVLAETFERDRAMPRRGVQVQTLYHEDARVGTAMQEWVEAMTVEGAEIRTLDEPFKRMFIIDRRVAVIPGDNILTTSAEATAYLVNDSGVANFLAQIFERDWQRATPWGAPAASGEDLTERELYIMRALAAGGTYETISRRLNVSKRTVIAAVSAIKAKWQVETQFELAGAWHVYKSKKGGRPTRSARR